MADIVKPTITIVLKVPFQFGSEHVSEIVIERPKVKHIRHIKDVNTTEGQLELLSQLTKKPPAFIDEIDAVDLEAISDKVNSFLHDLPAGK